MGFVIGGAGNGGGGVKEGTTLGALEIVAGIGTGIVDTEEGPAFERTADVSREGRHQVVVLRNFPPTQTAKMGFYPVRPIQPVLKISGAPNFRNQETITFR